MLIRLKKHSSEVGESRLTWRWYGGVRRRTWVWAPWLHCKTINS